MEEFQNVQLQYDNYIFVDLHIHSKYYPGARNDMNIDNITKIAKYKGLSVIGSGDALHPIWRKELKRKLNKKENLYEYNGIYIIPSVEVKLNTYVHSVIIMPTFEHFDDLYNYLKKFGKLDKTGAPFIKINKTILYELYDKIHSDGGLLFPAHIFIPFQSLYAKFKKISDFFNSLNIRAVEVTPSVDNKMAVSVSEIKDKTFLSNSDPHILIHLARNFNAIKTDLSYDNIIKSINNNINIINYEMPASLGKYYLTGCRKCGTYYTYKCALHLRFKCKCGGKIWIGTKDRIFYQLSNNIPNRYDLEQLLEKHPYRYHIPLNILIKNLLNLNLKLSDLIEKIYKKYNEIYLLHFADLSRISDLPKNIINIIKIFREKKYYIVPGGAWHAGKITLEPKNIEIIDCSSNKDLLSYLK